MDLFSQVDKGNIMISIDGNYMKMSTDNGVTMNGNAIKGQYLILGSSIGYLISNRFIVGIGLDYNWEKETRCNYLYINNYVQAEEDNIKSKVFIKDLYVGYYYQIINKLYFNANLKVSYGRIKSELNLAYAGMTLADTSSMWYKLSNSSSTNPLRVSKIPDVDFYSAKICPELTYFISARYGLCIGLGSIEYTMLNWKNSNSSWTINFNPSYWRLGIKFKI